jgi:hypothetical protein
MPEKKKNTARNADLWDWDWPWVSHGFVTGVSLYAAGPVLISLLKRTRVHSDTWKTAVAAGAFLGGFRLMRQVIITLSKFVNKESFWGLILARYRNFIAGCFATSFGLSVDDVWLGPVLTIWWALRAIRCLLPKLPFEHGSVAIMCASSAVLNPSAFLFKDEHQKSYQAFMERMALGIDRGCLLQPPNQVLKPGPGLHGWATQTICDELRKRDEHPGVSCSRSILLYILPKIFMISLRLYGPLYLAWSAFKLRLPNRQFLENVFRSTTFLTLYTSFHWYSVPLFTATVAPTITRMQMASFAWISGFFVFLERVERRPELAHYCLTHALNACYSILRKQGHFANLPRSRPVSRHFHLILSY